MKSSTLLLLSLSVFLLTFFPCEKWVIGDEPQRPDKIHRVDLVLHSHTDIGYTDHPTVTRERQKQYLDIAVDAILETENFPQEAKFHWTAEATHCVDDWWNASSPDRRDDLLRAIRSGQLEITAFAMNQSPYMNSKQWDKMMTWLPPEVRDAATIKVGMQNDVNGTPRAGAMRLLDRNVPFLWMSINGFNGGAPVSPPSAFWWKMPDGRRLFVWANTAYGQGYYFFHGNDWRQGPVPESTDTRFRLPREGDFFRSDEESVLNCHSHLCQTLRNMEKQGYNYPTLPISFTNQWRMDNDPPFPGMSAFVATWNRLELKPELRLCTATEALESLRDQVSAEIPEFSGEFTDWWADGSMSGPREVIASRGAKRIVQAATSSVFGAMTPTAQAKEEEILRLLCFFDEHTWGSVDSIGRPHDIDVLGQYNEKSRNAYLADALAKLLLSQRAWTAIADKEEGYYLVNTAPQSWSGRIDIPISAFREPIESFRDVKTNQSYPVELIRGFVQFSRADSPDDISPESDQGTVCDSLSDQVLRFWVDELPGHGIMQLVAANKEDNKSIDEPENHLQVATDALGWPIAANWGEQILFDQPQGNFVSVDFNRFCGRWLHHEVSHATAAAREESLRWTEAAANDFSQTQVTENSRNVVYKQTMSHPRLKWLTRTIEISKEKPQARLTVRFNRLSSELPEWFFIGTSVACDESIIPEASCGDLPFKPFDDQIPGTCRNYFAIDHYLQYNAKHSDANYLWISRDAPLITFGGRPEPILRQEEPPKKMNSIYAIVYNNFWMTNFLCDSPGIMEFRFDLLLRNEKEKETTGLVETLLSEPIFLNNAKYREFELYKKHLHQP